MDRPQAKTGIKFEEGSDTIALAIVSIGSQPQRWRRSGRAVRQHLQTQPGGSNTYICYAQIVHSLLCGLRPIAAGANKRDALGR